MLRGCAGVEYSYTPQTSRCPVAKRVSARPCDAVLNVDPQRVSPFFTTAQILPLFDWACRTPDFSQRILFVTAITTFCAPDYLCITDRRRDKNWHGSCNYLYKVSAPIPTALRGGLFKVSAPIPTALRGGFFLNETIFLAAVYAAGNINGRIYV